MASSTRRQFLKYSAALAAVAATQRSSLLHASALGLPIGLQLFSVREFLAKDYAGTLKKVGALGFKEVEAAGFFDHSPADVKTAMADAGLRCVSAHYSSQNLYPHVDEVIEYGNALGLDFIVCSSPARKDPSSLKDTAHKAMQNAFTMDDWHWNAEQFNAIGTKVAAAGMHFAYHNHTTEFRAKDGPTPFEELLRLTDPTKVSFEMDCGWVVVGGGDPQDLLRRYPNRFSMLHVKDFKSTTASPTGEPPASAEMGQGVLDNLGIFAAAKHAHIRHCFVEQEGFDMPPFESLKIDADYVAKLKS